MDVVTDFPERLQTEVRLFVGRHHRLAVIESCRAAGTSTLIKFKGTDSAQAASAFRNQTVYVRAADRPPLNPGQYYHHQLLGCTVFDEQDQPLGTLTEVLQTGANDVYVVERAAGGEILLPALDSVILQVNITDRTVRVRLPEFLGDDAGS